MARRAPIWHDQPRWGSRYQTPGMVYCTPNLLATRSRTRASVHRWSRWAFAVVSVVEVSGLGWVVSCSQFTLAGTGTCPGDCAGAVGYGGGMGCFAAMRTRAAA